MQIDWGGSRWVHNQAKRPDWVEAAMRKATGDATDKEKGDTRDLEDEEGPAYEQLTPSALRELRKWRGGPRWTDKLAKLIGKSWTGPEEEAPSIPAKSIWQVMLRCDAASRSHLKKRFKEDQRKAKHKERK